MKIIENTTKSMNISQPRPASAASAASTAQPPNSNSATLNSAKTPGHQVTITRGSERKLKQEGSNNSNGFKAQVAMAQVAVICFFLALKSGQNYCTCRTCPNRCRRQRCHSKIGTTISLNMKTENRLSRQATVYLERPEFRPAKTAVRTRLLATIKGTDTSHLHMVRAYQRLQKTHTDTA